MNSSLCRFRSLPFLLLILCAWLGGVSARADAPATIVLSSTPTRVERFAASELKKYLAAATGLQASIVHGTPVPSGGEIVFWVGSLTGDDRLVRDRFPLSRLGNAKLIEDGVCIDGDAKQILLAGQGDRGALNAVYTYLEDVIGCHWPEPERDYVPHLADWHPKSVRRVVNPQLYWRSWGNHGKLSKENLPKIADWEAKNRMNSVQVFPSPYAEGRDYFIDVLLDRGLLPNVGGHSRDYFLNGKKYLALHPEWFALDEGKRTEQLDYINFDSVPTYVDNVVAFLKKYPEIKVVSLWPNDGYGFHVPPGPGENSTDILLRYINKIAEGIHAQVPEVQSEFLAYIIYTAAPLKTRPWPYVMPTFCDRYGSFGGRDDWHPITDDIGANKALRAEMEKWIAMSTQVTEFCYYGSDGIHRFLYHPNEDVVTADIRYYHRVGLAGTVFELSNPETWWSNAATIYAYSRAAWDGDITVDRIKSDYYTSLYGPAAKAMEDHANAVIALYGISPAKQDEKGTKNVGSVDIAGKDYDTVLKQFAAGYARANEALDRARPLAQDEWFKERIRKLRSDNEWVYNWLRLQAGDQRLKAYKSAALKAELLDLIQRTLKLEVIAVDDAKGYDNANKELKRMSDGIAATATTLP